MPGRMPEGQCPQSLFLHLKWAHCPHFQDHHLQRGMWNPSQEPETTFVLLMHKQNCSWAHLGFRLYFFVSIVTGGMWEHAPSRAYQLAPVMSELQWKGHPHRKKAKLWGVWGTPGFRHPAWDFVFLKGWLHDTLSIHPVKNATGPGCI